MLAVQDVRLRFSDEPRPARDAIRVTAGASAPAVGAARFIV
jgi:hypothetical protein